MARLKSEISAGGIVLKNPGPKLLMIEVKNLLGEVVWTFPKGHIEPGENAREAAVREVLEETGWECKFAGNKPLKRVQYFFMRKSGKIRKTVVWFLMSPIRKTGSRDPEEVRRVRWATPAQAEKLTRYPSDKKLLEKISSLRKK